jgi:hypothetical protein
MRYLGYGFRGRVELSEPWVEVETLLDGEPLV